MQIAEGAADQLATTAEPGLLDALKQRSQTSDLRWSGGSTDLI